MKLSSFSFEKIKTIFLTGTHTYPVRDWFLLLGAAAILIGISIGWNIWSYVEATRTQEEIAPIVRAPVFDTSAVEAVEKAFATRKEEAGRYQDTYHFVDPSR
jgi:hypothetical protein